MATGAATGNMSNQTAHHKPSPEHIDTAPVSMAAEDILVTLAGRALSLATNHNRRIMIGIAGGPGSGKSTMAATLVDMLNEMVPHSAAVMGMDGYHREHAKLVATGDVEQKGAPHTLHAAGFISQIKKLKSTKENVSCPAYSREIEDVVPDAFTIAGNVPIIIVEGNYLLLGHETWSELAGLFDLSVHLSVPRDVVMRRLLARHAEHGLFDQDHINKHVDKVDMANYDLVEAARGRADLVFDVADAR